jgi:hypothetical protein
MTTKTCFICKIEKDLSEFHKSNKNRKDPYMAYCKPCHNYHSGKRLKERKLIYIEKFGSKCNNCGESYHSSVYEFHHLYDKDYSWNQLCGRKEETIEKELSKCIMLCANCHRLQHLNGTHMPKEEIVSEQEINTADLKSCIKCNTLQPINNFFKRKNRKNPFTTCKKCFSIYNIKRQRENKLKAIIYFNNKCNDCNQSYNQNIYDFHHLYDKDRDWSKLRLLKEERIQQELSKCVMLCANCHRVRHYDSQNNPTQ